MPDEFARRFELKGKKAEEYLLALATKTFLTDWCYPSPKLANGKELCDLLIVFDDTVIIWQVKDLKLDEHGKYSASEVEKNFRQLAGARRMMFDVKAPLDLTNPRRGTERFDPATISHVYLVSGFLGEPEDYHTLFGEAKSHKVHVFTREFTEVILSELDTISDFTHYLATKQSNILDNAGNRQIIISGGEDELLALYIRNNRSLPMFGPGLVLVTIDEGHWEDLQQNPDYLAKKQADKMSYLWDQIIDGAHQSGDPQYEIAAREMARLNRFERRGLSQFMMDAWHKAQQVYAQKGNVFRRTVAISGTTYCFAFADKHTISPISRKNMLMAYCFISRGVPQFSGNEKVIGIATEIQHEESGSNDLVYLHWPEWTEEDEKRASELRDEYNIGKNASLNQVHVSEYPRKQDEQ